MAATLCRGGERILSDHRLFRFICRRQTADAISYYYYYTRVRAFCKVVLKNLRIGTKKCDWMRLFCVIIWCVDEENTRRKEK